MTQCFKEHRSDKQLLNHNSTPVADCECKEELLYGVKTFVTEVPILTCACLWRTYQSEAEEIVAPKGVLIADPVERNRAINAAYARLWLHDSRFQWAGLAAFASKQVGCGLLHAVDSVERIREEHEQRNILQPSIYEDRQLVALLRTNHASYVTGFPSGVAQAIELTLASQCQRVEDGRTIGFGNNLLADLSDIDQRMSFVLQAAARFDEMLHDNNRGALEQSIGRIASGVGGL
jgi:hypothetical protein